MDSINLEAAPFNFYVDKNNVLENDAKYIEMEEVNEKDKDNNLSSSPIDHLGDYTEKPYTIIESYFKDRHLDRLVKHQIESYNHFINYQAEKTTGAAMFKSWT